MTILYVDDDPDDRFFFVEALKAVDDRVMCSVAASALDALSGLDSLDLPDVVFLDINMPLMNGKACLSEIRLNVRTAQLPVYIFTTSNSPGERMACLRLGATGYIRKPSSYSEMKSILQTVLESLHAKGA